MQMAQTAFEPEAEDATPVPNTPPGTSPSVGDSAIMVADNPSSPIATSRVTVLQWPGGGRSLPHRFPGGRATVAPGHLRRLAALINKHPVPGIALVYLLLPCLGPPPVFRRVLVRRAERLYLAAGSSAGAGATYAA